MTHVHTQAAPAGESFLQFFQRLFDSDFVPRLQCVNQRTDLLWLHVVSDLIIALAYYSIPLALLYFVRKRRDQEFNWMYVMFAAFIVACGTTHLVSVAAFWNPMYRLDGVVKALTAGISIATAALLWPLIPHALKLPSPAQLARVNADLAREVAERRDAESGLSRIHNELEARVQERTATLAAEIAERRRVEEHRALLMAELDHRVKNNLYAVMSIAEQTVAASRSLADFAPSFLGRVRSLAQTHSALAQSRWEGARLDALVRQILAPHANDDGDNISVSGESVMLRAKTASALAMALHELATNSAKYGAFSLPSGRVDVAWNVHNTASTAPRLRLTWSESGGPPVASPVRGGLGTIIIEGAIAYELRGTVHTDYLTTGVRCTIDFPLPVPALFSDVRPPAEGTTP